MDTHLKRLAPTRLEAVLRHEHSVVQEENKAERDKLLHLSELEEAQQDGRGVSRRTFVGGVAATATALATAEFATTQVAFAAGATKTLIHVFLYGGMDGLSLIAPANDPVLAKARPDLTLPENGSIAIDRNFMLTGAFAPLDKYLKAGKLAFVPAVTDPRISESHFQATDACNLGGLPTDTGGRGWLDSLTEVLGKGTLFRSVGIGTTLPRSLVGTTGAISMNSVGSLRLNGDDKYNAATLAAIKGLFSGINHPVEDVVKAGLGAMSTAKKLTAQPYAPAAGVQYEGVGNQFKELAMLIKGGANVRIATVGIGAWDTHFDQGTRDGYIYRAFNGLAKALAAFFDDLGPQSDDVTVMVTSEFGRRVAQNGSGTDHGHGGAAILLSGKKLAGSLLGTWNGLEKLDYGNVPEYNNMFDLYGTVAQGRFGLTDAQVRKLFPTHAYKRLRLFA